MPFDAVTHFIFKDCQFSKTVCLYCSDSVVRTFDSHMGVPASTPDSFPQRASYSRGFPCIKHDTRKDDSPNPFRLSLSLIGRIVRNQNHLNNPYCWCFYSRHISLGPPELKLAPVSSCIKHLGLIYLNAIGPNHFHLSESLWFKILNG